MDQLVTADGGPNTEPSNVLDIENAKAAAAAQPQVNPLDQAAHMFSSSLPRIRALSGNMSRNSLARVYKAIVEFPLAEDYPKFRNKSENELFILTLATIDAKNMMTASFSQSMKKEIVQEVENNMVQEILANNVTEKKEEGNG